MMQKSGRQITGHRKSGSKRLQFRFGTYRMINRLVLVLPYLHMRCSEEHVFQPEFMNTQKLVYACLVETFNQIMSLFFFLSSVEV